MLKKTAIALVLLFISLPLHSQSGWIKQNIQTDNNFSKVFFADSLHGWICGDSAYILYTSNGGGNWIKQYSYPQDFINDIFFLNIYTGWAAIWRSNGVQVRSLIFSTTNSGTNWTQIPFPDTTTLLSSIYFLNRNTGFAGCFYSQTKIIQKTTDGGFSWNSVNMDTIFISNFPVRTMKFINSMTGFAAGGFYDMGGVVWKTTNGGNYWTVQSIGSEPLNSISFPDNNTIMMSGGDYEFGVSISTSSDGGNHWDYNPTGYFGIGYSAAFRTQNDGWISTGFSQKFMHTTDKGISWNYIDTPDSSAIYSICFPNSKTGWAVGSSGAILKYIAQPIFVSGSEEIISGFKLKDALVYPNPFNSSSNIKFNMNKNAVVKCSLYDVAGKEIFSNRISAVKGVNIIPVDLSFYASGIYFVRLNETASGENAYIKLILVK